MNRALVARQLWKDGTQTGPVSCDDASRLSDIIISVGNAAQDRGASAVTALAVSKRHKAIGTDPVAPRQSHSLARGNREFKS